MSKLKIKIRDHVDRFDKLGVAQRRSHKKDSSWGEEETIVEVIWKKEHKTRYGAPYPTTFEKLIALDAADSHGATRVDFEYPAGSVVRCSCGWPADSGPDKSGQCTDCEKMNRMGTIMETGKRKKRGAEKLEVKKRTTLGEIDVMAQRAEMLSQKYATIAANLEQHARTRGGGDSSLTSGTKMLSCIPCEYVLVIAESLQPRCPHCRGELSV